MRKADYTYTIEHGVVYIIDLNLGNVSVTNDAENVLTEINENELNAGHEGINKLKIMYRDSDESWDEIIPHWSSTICKYVQFFVS